MKAISCDLAKIKSLLEPFWLLKGECSSGSSQTAREVVRIHLGYLEENQTELYR